MEKILYVVSSPDMSSYAAGFFNALKTTNSIDVYVAIFLWHNDLRREDDVYISYGLENHNVEKIFIFRYPIEKFYLHIYYYRNILKIKNISIECRITKIHFLTQDTFLAYYLWLFKKNLIYYTVHDLEPHPARLNFIGRIKKYLFLTMKDKWIVKNVDNLITSSEHQYQKLVHMFPKKRVSRHSMPSLITPAIARGTDLVPELIDLEGYVLFFGRIEAYKGVEHLYNSFKNSRLLKDINLVIAGKGKIYFDRDLNSEKNVIFINRFIHEAEMNNLFNKASIIVLPYTSATQSAVTSFGYHFLKPMIVSDLAGLKDTVADGKTALLVNPINHDELEKKIFLLISNDSLYKIIQESLIDNRDIVYGTLRLQEQIEEIYQN